MVLLGIFLMPPPALSKTIHVPGDHGTIQEAIDAALDGVLVPVEVKFVGVPGTAPVGLWLGTGMLEPPIPSMWGDWYPQFPIFGPFVFGSIPIPSGVLICLCKVPKRPPTPYTVPMQTLIGQELTNPFILSVE